MREVWVLSEESPFDDPEGSGGCVCGVFATLAAAMFALGTEELGPERLAALTWTPFQVDAYEGHGAGEAIYILRRHVVQTEATLRGELAAWHYTHALPLHPYLALSTADLEALVKDAEGET